jgi:glycosyltransferase involved in cell wall biosynthesis
MENFAPRIGVAIATYNGQRFIAELLSSIERQTRKPDLISVSDDCSTDKTVEIVEEFSRKSTVPIVIHRMEKQVGIIDNFLHAFSMCDTDYIFYCDQDDVWDTARVSKCFSHVNDSVSLLFHRSTVTNESLEQLSVVPEKSFDGEFSFPYFPDYIWGFGHQMVFHKSVYLLVQELLFLDRDGLLPRNFDWLIPVASGMLGDIVVLEDQLIKFRRHSDAASPAQKTDGRQSESVLMYKVYNAKRHIKTVIATIILIRANIGGVLFPKSCDIYTAHLNMMLFRYLIRLEAYEKRGLRGLLMIGLACSFGAYGRISKNKLPIRCLFRDILACFLRPLDATINRLGD